MKDKSIFLRNNALYHEIVEYNPNTKKMVNVEHNDGIKISGFYNMKNDEAIMLYKLNNYLYVNIDSTEISLTDNNLSISFERIEKNNKIVIKLGTKVIHSLLYPSYVFDPVNIIDPDFNDFKEEDQDFLLFIYNIFRNEERQKVLLEVWA